MSTAVPKVDGRANDSHKPPAFAWSLVDGEKPRIPPEHHDPAHSQMGESEYTRKFHWPTAEQYRAQQQQAQRRGSGDRSGKDTLAATLFPVDSVSSQAVQPLLSEYQQQYYDKDIFGNDARPPASPKRDSNAPKQFAWALSNNGAAYSQIDEDADDTKVKRLRPATSDLSEHTNKYKWPVGAEAHHVIRKPDESHALKVGQVFALDDDQQDPRGWATEYDEKFHKLRQRQRALAASVAANTGDEHVAGVPTAARPAIPSNFAWKETDVPPPPVTTRVPKHVSPDHFHTEYEEKFLAWKNAQAATDAPPQFAWPLVDQPRVLPPPSPTKPSKPLEKSEYETKFLWPTQTQPVKSFKPQADPTTVSTAPPMAIEEGATAAQWKSETQDPTAASKKPKKAGTSPTVAGGNHSAGLVYVRDEDVPSFFAWADAEAQKVPVVMPPPPPEQPVAIVKSEMHSEFRGNVTLVNRPEQGKSSEWMSEYDARCAETFHSRSSSSSSASSRARASSAPPSLRRSSATPPFFVWSATDAAQALPTPPPLPKPAQNYPTETSEYREHFIDWQEAATSAEEDRSHLRGTHKARPEQAHQVASLLCDPPTATRPAAHTTMQSEYDANFVGGGSDVVHVGHTDMQRPTLAYTNLDKYTPMPPPPPAPIQVKVNPNAAMQFRTEYSDHFTWQAKSPTAATSEDATTANNKKSLAKKAPTNRMKAQAVAVKKSIPHRSDANKEQAGTTLQSTINQLMDKPPGTDTTEYRRQFSWPDASRKANDIELEREGAQHAKIVLSEAQRRQRLQEQKRRFHLMSKSMSSSALRDNHFRSQPTTATSTTATIVSESECASMNQTTTVSSSSAGRPAYNKVMPGSPVSVSTNPSSPPPAAVAASTKEPAYIPGLRDYDPQYRSRSAPPRKVVGTWYADSALTRSVHM
eukprot:gene7999-5756_t